MPELPGRRLPQPIVTAEMVESAMKVALSSTAAARRLPHPSAAAMDGLLVACVIAQANMRNNGRRVALASARRGLLLSLQAALKAVNTIDALRRSFEEMPIDGDANYDFLEYLEEPSEATLSYAEETHDLLALMATDLKAMMQSEILTNLIEIAGAQKWHSYASQLADAFLTAISSISPTAGRLKLPPHFIAAIVPALTGETTTWGAVRIELSSKKDRSSPRQTKKRVKTE